MPISCKHPRTPKNISPSKLRPIHTTDAKQMLCKKLNITHYARLVLISDNSTEGTEVGREGRKPLQIPVLITHRHYNSSNCSIKEKEKGSISKEIATAHDSQTSSRREDQTINSYFSAFNSKRTSRNRSDKNKLMPSTSIKPLHKTIDLSREICTYRKKNNEELIQGKLECYTIMKSIGQGAYAVVKEGIGKSSRKKCAIKIYEKYKLNDAQKKKGVCNETKVLSELSHPNIASLYEVIDTMKQLLLVMEYFHGVSLQVYVQSLRFRRVKEADCRKIFKQIVSSLSYCHQKNICHRDLKLDNILIDKAGVVKLIDFGFSCVCHEDKPLNVYCGTPSYMSPEIVGKVPYNGKMADMWALGVVLYVLLSGYYPFKASNNSELYSRISKGFYNMPDELSDDAKNLISHLLVVDTQKRWRAEQVLAHNFLNLAP